MPVFSSYSAQLSSIIVLSLLHYIMMHMYQLSFILVDWLWPIFVGRRSGINGSPAYVPMQNVVHVTWNIVAILYYQKVTLQVV